MKLVSSNTKDPEDDFNQLDTSNMQPTDFLQAAIHKRNGVLTAARAENIPLNYTLFNETQAASYMEALTTQDDGKTREFQIPVLNNLSLQTPSKRSSPSI